MAFINDKSSRYTVRGRDTSNDSIDFSTSFYRTQFLKNQRRAYEITHPNEPTLDASSQPKMYTRAVFNSDIDKLEKDMEVLNRRQNADMLVINGRRLFQMQNYEYNRFKIPNVANTLQHTTSHVFFVRPNCNILEPTEGGAMALTTTAKTNQTMSSAYLRNPDLLRNLCYTNPAGYSMQINNFMMLLSNAAASFQLKDEYIKVDNTLESLSGYSMLYGKGSAASKANDSFSITFHDDRDLNIYQLNKCWVDYISGVAVGSMDPTIDSILNRELDYTSSVYYFLTSEDGETLIFWSKYYGVFPKTIASSGYGWQRGETLSNPTLNIEFNYMWKEDYVLDTLREFNSDAFPWINLPSGTIPYEPIFNKGLMQLGNTWVTSPFIDFTTFESSLGVHVPKLRFYRPVDTTDITGVNPTL